MVPWLRLQWVHGDFLMVTWLRLQWGTWRLPDGRMAETPVGYMETS